MHAARECIRSAQVDYSEAIDSATEDAQWKGMDSFCAEHGIDAGALDDGTHQLRMVPVSDDG